MTRRNAGLRLDLSKRHSLLAITQTCFVIKGLAAKTAIFFEPTAIAIECMMSVPGCYRKTTTRLILPRRQRVRSRPKAAAAAADLACL